jgi:hypothetical protein
MAFATQKELAREQRHTKHPFSLLLSFVVAILLAAADNET